MRLWEIMSEGWDFGFSFCYKRGFALRVRGQLWLGSLGVGGWREGNGGYTRLSYWLLLITHTKRLFKDDHWIDLFAVRKERGGLWG